MGSLVNKRASCHRSESDITHQDRNPYQKYQSRKENKNNRVSDETPSEF